jgi:hypothetical protein
MPSEVLASFLTAAALSMTVLAAGTATTIADQTVTRWVFQAGHIKIETTRNFTDVQAAFEAGLPKLDPSIIKALAAGDEQRVTQLEQGNALYDERRAVQRSDGFLFLRRPLRAVQSVPAS